MTDHRTSWCAIVGGLVYPFDPARAATAITAYLPLLADLPDAAFSAKSAEVVALAPRRMAIPSYDEVVNPLVKFWRDMPPDRPRIAQDTPRARSEPIPAAGPTDAEKAAVDAVVQSFVQSVRAKGVALRKEVKPAYLTGEALRQFRASRIAL